MKQHQNGIDRRDFLKTAIGAGVGACLASVPGFSAAQAEKKGVWEMKYDCYIAKTAETARLDDWFLDEIEKKSGGRIVIKKFWGSSLRKVPEHLPAIKQGLSEISLIAWGYYTKDLPVSSGLEWYYRGCNHSDSLLKVCRDMYDSFPELKKEWEEKQNAKVLYFSNWTYCPFLMKNPLPNIEALKGLKIRGYGIASDTVNRFGGIGTPMAAAEVYGALEKGTLDGAFGFAFVTAERMKIHEKAPYIVECGSGAHGPTTVVMNLDLWKSLPDDLKEMISKTAEEVYQGKLAELHQQLIGESVDRMVKGGAQFSTWSDSEIEKAAKLIQPAQTDAWIENVAKPLGVDGQAFQNKINELIKKYEPGKLKNPWQVYQGKYGK